MVDIYIIAYWSEELGEVDIYMDSDEVIVEIQDRQDAEWKHEYFNEIFKKFGLTVAKVFINELDLEEKVNKYLQELSNAR